MPKKSAKELLAAARLPERHVSICLRGDLVADIQALEDEQKADLENRLSNGRLGTKSRAKELQAAIDAKREEMAESTIVFRLRAMKRAQWSEMIGRYPSKDPNKFVDLLPFMGEAIPASTVEPEGLDEEDWANLNENVAPAEMGKLIDAVWELNTQGVDVPKSRYASVVSRLSSDD